MEVAAGIGVAALLIGLVVWQVLLRKKFAALPPEVQANISKAKEAKKKYRQVSKARERSIKSATSYLENVESPKGKRLGRVGGASLYQRWIDTPQGGGSLLGVKAEAADESSVRQRLTVTRMVTLGVFSLAAPKNKGGGNAYVVIEGPEVSGVATISAENNKNAGPAAFAFAAQINNAARAAEKAEPLRPKEIENARSALERAKDESLLAAAEASYAQAVAALPAAHRTKFDVPQRVG